MSPRKISIQEEETLNEAVGKKEIICKHPKSFDIYEVELSGDLVLLRGWSEAFGKQIDSTRVFKRVR